MIILDVFFSIISWVIALAPIVLYFKNRGKTNFADEIKIIAMLDVIYLLSWIFAVIDSGSLVPSANSFIEGVLGIVIPVATLYCVWKMKVGATFKSLFKNPGINKALFVVYVAANIVIAYQLLITMINYLIVAVVFVVLVWIIDKALGLGAGTALLSGGGQSTSSSSEPLRLEPGDGSCDKKVTENGVVHNLTEDGIGYRDENGKYWMKDGNGVRRS